ncbi:MAG TPA: iron-sulfur cluster assembly accessory protein [Candidatus Hydrogenedentes bacterium]|nr:iron-sulfur cluster assembly accessory protein [Candidatus Hydrogenedentota bacterium]HNT89475.1 iron-sulfur cluster assembly accessory protein [Candidatus Hydrogenedentota bacterium]
MSHTETSPTKALITATPEAVAELKRLAETEGRGKDGVRLGVKGGGCSGFSYVLDFDARRDGDNVVEQDGVAFLIDRKSAIYLKGIELDFRSGLRGKGFVFQNPNASSTCGCGESFAV